MYLAKWVLQVDQKDQNKALYQAEETQNKDLGEEVGGNTEIDCPLALVDGCLFDNFACSIEASKHNSGKSHDEKDLLSLLATMTSLNRAIKNLGGVRDMCSPNLIDLCLTVGRYE